MALEGHPRKEPMGEESRGHNSPALRRGSHSADCIRTTQPNSVRVRHQAIRDTSGLQSPPHSLRHSLSLAPPQSLPHSPPLSVRHPMLWNVCCQGTVNVALWHCACSAVQHHICMTLGDCYATLGCFCSINWYSTKVCAVLPAT